MKRIVKLKGEITFFVIISIILGAIIGAVPVKTYRTSNRGIEELRLSAIQRSREYTEFIIKELDIESKDYNVLSQKMKNLKDNMNIAKTGSVFLVDNDGFVIESTENFGVEKIDLGARKYEDIKVDGNIFVSKNVIKLNENMYAVITNSGFSDGDMNIMGIWVVASIIIFLILISGRVRYINKIAKNVRVIAKGDMTKRIDIKYKNELTHLAKDINYMAQEIMEQDASQKEFITNISHDLRTPLTTILGYSKMIEEKKYSSEEELERYVSVINRKGMYLRTLLEDFFDYAKLSSMDIKMEKEVININESILQLLDGEEICFKENGLELEVLLESKSIYTYGDPMLIARAFENLISNAVKYSKGNSKVTIKLKEEVIEKISYGVFSIYNIPRENLSDKEVDKLFKRLYKSDSARSKGGSGLGLAICQEIVKCHNGFIKAQKINNGIEFLIGLAEIH